MEWIRILFPWTILGIVIVGCYYDGFPITEEQVCKSSVYMMQSVEAPMITFTQRSWPEMYFDFEVRWKWHDQVHRTQYINHTSVVIHLDHVLNFTKQDFIEISWYNRSHYEDHGIYGGPYFDLTLKTRSDQSIPSNDRRVGWRDAHIGYVRYVENACREPLIDRWNTPSFGMYEVDVQIIGALVWSSSSPAITTARRESSFLSSQPTPPPGGPSRLRDAMIQKCTSSKSVRDRSLSRDSIGNDDDDKHKEESAQDCQQDMKAHLMTHDHHRNDGLTNHDEKPSGLIQFILDSHQVTTLRWEHAITWRNPYLSVSMAMFILMVFYTIFDTTVILIHMINTGDSNDHE